MAKEVGSVAKGFLLYNIVAIESINGALRWNLYNGFDVFVSQCAYLRADFFFCPSHTASRAIH